MTVYSYTGMEGGFSMPEKSKIATITKKRQVTIPKEFFDELNLKPGKVKCFIDDGNIVLEPLNKSSFWDFSSEILKELVAEGYEGNELISKFNERKGIVKETLAVMVEEAKEEIEKGNTRSSEDIFEEILKNEE